MPRARNGHDKLTPAETRVLAALAAGAKGQAGIGDRLGIKVTTVNTHLINARAKLRATTNTHAVALAMTGGLLTQGHHGIS